MEVSAKFQQLQMSFQSHDHGRNENLVIPNGYEAQSRLLRPNCVRGVFRRSF